MKRTTPTTKQILSEFVPGQTQSATALASKFGITDRLMRYELSKILHLHQLPGDLYRLSSPTDNAPKFMTAKEYRYPVEMNGVIEKINAARAVPSRGGD